MRIRLPELLEERKITAYEVAKRSDGRIIGSTLYRLARSRGRVRFIDSDLLEALADVLDVKSMDDLLEREGKRKRGR